MADMINNTHIVRAIENLCATIEREKEFLSELDGAIGDGDHGVNMAKCFREVKKNFPRSLDQDIESIFKGVGMIVLNSVGGAMGALYGTFFLRLAQESAGKAELDLSDLVKMLQAGEKGILDIGKAQLGDKTMIDSISPAVRALEEAEKAGKSLSEALRDFDVAARKGMESTKEMVARIGRASRLGERTIGHQDAGATSCYFILRSIASGYTDETH